MSQTEKKHKKKNGKKKGLLGGYEPKGSQQKKFDKKKSSKKPYKKTEPKFKPEYSEQPEVSEAQELPAETFKSFLDLTLPEPIMEAIKELGFEKPTPIQAAMIPHVMEGKDVIGQAQTGTGKTAAFALPLVANIAETQQKKPSVLVLAPTRELAGQVAEGFESFGKNIKNLKLATIYGGASYPQQIKELKRGAQIVIGTPGRVLDHAKKGTLDLSELQCLVLDEADEMLRVGFLEDVEWVLENTPDARQVCLFSATMPKEIRKIGRRYLHDPVEIKIEAKTETATTIKQCHWPVKHYPKVEAASRFIEGLDTDGILIFTKTKAGTTELADALKDRGFKAAALNGDMAQGLREHTVAQLKCNQLDIIVATDVAARGLDVPRISHVINYDMPQDAETYVHRIGRTGRAGREGMAILFTPARNRRELMRLESHTRQKIEEIQLPKADDINARRLEKFSQRIQKVLEGENVADYEKFLYQLCDREEHSLEQIAVALAAMAHSEQDIFATDAKPKKFEEGGKRKDRGGKQHQDWDDYGTGAPHLYRLSVGKRDGVRPNMIVGAIANELGIPGKAIGPIRIQGNFSTVGLPASMPSALQDSLRQIRIAGRPLNAKLVH